MASNIRTLTFPDIERVEIDEEKARALGLLPWPPPELAKQLEDMWAEFRLQQTPSSWIHLPPMD